MTPFSEIVTFAESRIRYHRTRLEEAFSVDLFASESSEVLHNQSMVRMLTEAVASGQPAGLLRPTKEGLPITLDQELSWLVQNSTTDPLAFSTLQETVSRLVLLSSPLPEPLREWCSKRLMGQVRPPKIGGKKPASYQIIVVLTIREVLQQFPHISATRNDEKSPSSACDAVAKALENLKLPSKTFLAVKQIWLNRSEHFLERDKSS